MNSNYIRRVQKFFLSVLIWISMKFRVNSIKWQIRRRIYWFLVATLACTIQIVYLMREKTYYSGLIADIFSLKKDYSVVYCVRVQ